MKTRIIAVIFVAVSVSPRNMVARIPVWISIVFCKTESSKALTFFRTWFQREKATAVLITLNHRMIANSHRETTGRPSTRNAEINKIHARQWREKE